MYPFIVRFDAQVKEDEEKRKAPLMVKNDLSILFLRYGVIKNGSKAEDYRCSSGNSSSADSLSVSQAPALPDAYAYKAFPLRGGFMYVYYETEDKWAEYRVTDALRLQSIIWDEHDYNRTNRIPKRNPKTGRWDEYTGLPVGKNKVVWVAWSEVQWGARYAAKVLTTEELRKGRMQKVDIAKWKKNEKQEDVFHASEISVTAYAGEYSEFSQLQDKIKFVMRDEDEQQNNLFMVLHDPLGAADDVVSLLHKEYKHLDTLSTCMLAGATSTEMQEEYKAAYSVGLTLYLTIFSESHSKAYGNKYRDRLDRKVLEAMLGVKKRAQQRELILKIRDVLGAILHSNYYQNILFDYTENSDFWRLEGETRVTNMHYGPLSDMPHFHDQHLDLYNPKRGEEDKWRKFIADSFSDEKVSGVARLLSSDFQYKKPTEEFQPVSFRLYFKDYEKSSIPEAEIELLDKLFGSLSTALSLYGPYIGNKLKNSQLLVKLNKLKIEGDKLVRIKETTIKELNWELEKNIKNIHSKKKRIINKQSKKINKAYADKIEKALAKFTAESSSLDSHIGETKVKVLELLHKKGKFSSNNYIALLDELVAGLDMVNAIAALNTVTQEGGAKNNINLVGALTSLISSTLSLSTQTMRTFDLRITKFLFKNAKVFFSTRLSWVACIVVAIVDGINTSERFKANDYNAALCYTLSAAAGAGVAVGAAANALYTAAWGGPLAWACLVVGVIAGGLAVWLTDDDLEAFLSATIFGKNNCPKSITPDCWPDKVMSLLYQHRGRLDKDLVISDVHIDMRSFKKMDDWLRNFFMRKEESCTYSPYILKHGITPNKLGLGNDYCYDFLLEKLYFSSSFVVTQPFVVKVDGILYLYLVYNDGECGMHEIPVENEVVTEEGDSGYIFSINSSEIHKFVATEVAKKKGDTVSQWDCFLNKNLSCYYLLYRIYFNISEEENYMPYDDEYSVVRISLFNYYKGSQNRITNNHAALNHEKYKDFKDKMQNLINL